MVQRLNNLNFDSWNKPDSLIQLSDEFSRSPFTLKPSQRGQVQKFKLQFDTEERGYRRICACERRPIWDYAARFSSVRRRQPSPIHVVNLYRRSCFRYNIPNAGERVRDREGWKINICKLELCHQAVCVSRVEKVDTRQPFIWNETTWAYHHSRHQSVQPLIV